MNTVRLGPTWLKIYQLWCFHEMIQERYLNKLNPIFLSFCECTQNDFTMETVETAGVESTFIALGVSTNLLMYTKKLWHCNSSSEKLGCMSLLAKK